MNAELEGKTILITGGTGSIGSELVNQLLRYKVNNVIVFSRDEIKQFIIKQRIRDDRLKTFIGDIRDYRSIQAPFDEYDIDLVYHAAAMKHIVMCEDFPVECANTNIFGTKNLVDLSLKHEISKLVAISTDKSAYPVNVMGATKFISERIVLNAGYTCVRFGNVANSRGSVIPIFVDALLNKKPIIVTDPNVTRFMMEINQAVNLILKATRHAKGGETFILKMKAFHLGDLVDVCINNIAFKLNLSGNDIKINKIGLVSGEKLHEDLINDVERDRLFELDDMYVLLKNSECSKNYPSLKRSNIENYCSKNADFMEKDELESIINNYLTNYLGKEIAGEKGLYAP